MTALDQGSPHARHSDPATSKRAGRGDFTGMKYRACLLMSAADKGQGLTALDVDRLCARDVVRARFGDRPLGVSPWRRITDCAQEGWVAVITDASGQPEVRRETNGKDQQVYHVTDLGHAVARDVFRAMVP